LKLFYSIVVVLVYWRYRSIVTDNDSTNIKYICVYICIYIILPVVLYRSESWSLALREECRLRIFENKVLRRIFGPKRDEVTGDWRRLHNKELYALYSSPNIIWVIKSRRLR
jgi:hypothetical protein